MEQLWNEVYKELVAEQGNQAKKEVNIYDRSNLSFSTQKLMNR